MWGWFAIQMMQRSDNIQRTNAQHQDEDSALKKLEKQRVNAYVWPSHEPPSDTPSEGL
jgi:hypothetical protein